MLFSAIAALLSGLFFFSCNNTAERGQGMQEPSVNKEEAGEYAQLTGQKGEEATAMVITNLSAAFTGEATASAKYAAYSKKAQEEGYPEIAMLFKAASTSENIHANNHRSVLEEMGVKAPDANPSFVVKTTRENLQDAIAGETYEITTMYPEFLANANSANAQLALISLNYAYKTEQKHKPLYEKALAALEGNQVKSLSMQYYICPTCGNTYDTTPPKRCGISMTSGERFLKIDSI